MTNIKWPVIAIVIGGKTDNVHVSIVNKNIRLPISGMPGMSITSKIYGPKIHDIHQTRTS